MAVQWFSNILSEMYTYNRYDDIADLKRRLDKGNPEWETTDYSDKDHKIIQEWVRELCETQGWITNKKFLNYFIQGTIDYDMGHLLYEEWTDLIDFYHHHDESDCSEACGCDRHLTEGQLSNE